MTRIALDTNIIVSALWSPQRVCAQVVELALANKVSLCYNDDMLREYTEVLRRDKFSFLLSNVDKYLSDLVGNGLRVIASPCDIPMIDESDRPFYETAKEANAYLITGNARHFPKEPFIVSPSDFLSILNRR